MKIEEIRTSFTVYAVASRLDALDGLIEALGLAGYMVARFDNVTSAFSEFFSNPPHMLLFDFEEKNFDLSSTVAQVREQLPESHVYMAVPADQRDKAAAAFETKVYDFVLTPPSTPHQLVRAFDRAAERDYFMYLNEQLAAAPTSAPAAPPQAPADDFVERLFATRSEDEALESFMRHASARLGGGAAVYFKYIQNRRVLIAAKGENLKGVDLKGLGVNFNESAQGFRTSHLHQPNSLTEINSLMREVFGTEEYFAMPVEVLGEVHGLIFFLGQFTSAQTEEVRRSRALLEKAMSLLESEKRLHVLSIKDPATDLVNRQTFINKIAEEVSRSRRTNSPLSLVLIAVDQYGRLVSQCGAEEAQIVLRMMARIFEKHSRVNDVIGRTAADEFGLLLPHTGKKGAMIKAERIRRIIESADFSRVISAFPQFTISLGVSEYPTLVRDAEELLQSADEALLQVRQGGNKTCVASAPEGFIADFPVQEKGL